MKIIKSLRYLNKTSYSIALFFVSAAIFSQGVIKGEKNSDDTFKKWHRIEIEFNGPQADESKNTFFNNRLDVTFTSPTNKKYKVPGFFDADGNPANSGATAGKIWKVRFCAGEEGTWTYVVSFVTGTNVAAELSGGTKGTAPDGFTGNFKVGKQDKVAPDFRAKGKLEYVGEHYLQFADGDYFFKASADSPEVFLADKDFDGSLAVANSIGNVDHSAQISDWKTGDPTWRNGKGKGIIGVVNYLSSVGVNGHYFITMNINGDGKKSFPFVDYNSPQIYDVSKLGQWEIVFTHFDAKGLMLHILTQEIENCQYFEDQEGGSTTKPFSDTRKVYYRELVARFGHHMAITWNIGEENNRVFGYNIRPNSTEQRKLFAERIRSLAYYKDHLVVHNGYLGQKVALDLYNPLLGNPNYTGTSLHLPFADVTTHDVVKYWWLESEKIKPKWVVSFDEPYENALLVNDIEKLRKDVIWPTLTAGGGVEWYLGANDLSLNLDYKTLDAQFKVLGHAAKFMNTQLSKIAHKLKPNDDLISKNTTNYALSEIGNKYLLYLKEGGNQSVDLSAAKGSTFELLWFDPKTGITTKGKDIVAGNAFVSLGNPPSDITADWLALLSNKQSLDLLDKTPIDETSVKINPNPIADTFTIIGLDAKEILSVKLFDLTGKENELTTKMEKNGLLSGSLENLSAGGYVLQIQTNNKTISKKILKK